MSSRCQRRCPAGKHLYEKRLVIGPPNVAEVRSCCREVVRNPLLRIANFPADLLDLGLRDVYFLLGNSNLCFYRTLFEVKRIDRCLERFFVCADLLSCA